MGSHFTDPPIYPLLFKDFFFELPPNFIRIFSILQPPLNWPMSECMPTVHTQEWVTAKRNDTERPESANKENNLLFVKCFVDVVTVGVKVFHVPDMFIRNEYTNSFHFDKSRLIKAISERQCKRAWWVAFPLDLLNQSHWIPLAKISMATHTQMDDLLHNKDWNKVKTKTKFAPIVYTTIKNNVHEKSGRKRVCITYLDSCEIEFIGGIFVCTSC